MLRQQEQEFRHQNPTQTLKIHLSCFDSLLIYFWFHVFIIFLLDAVLFRALSSPSAYPFISGKCLLPLVLSSTHSLEGRHPAFSTQTVKQRYCYRFYSHHPERLCSLESSDPQRSDEQEGRTDRHLAPRQERGSEEQEGEEPSYSPACGWSWTPRWTWSALHPYTSPGPGKEGWWTITWNDRARINAEKHR